MHGLNFRLLTILSILIIGFRIAFFSDLLARVEMLPDHCIYSSYVTLLLKLSLCEIANNIYIQSYIKQCTNRARN